MQFPEAVCREAVSRWLGRAGRGSESERAKQQPAISQLGSSPFIGWALQDPSQPPPPPPPRRATPGLRRAGGRRPPAPHSHRPLSSRPFAPPLSQL